VLAEDTAHQRDRACGGEWRAVAGLRCEIAQGAERFGERQRGRRQRAERREQRLSAPLGDESSGGHWIHRDVAQHPERRLLHPSVPGMPPHSALDQREAALRSERLGIHGVERDGKKRCERLHLRNSVIWVSPQRTHERLRDRQL